MEPTKFEEDCEKCARYLLRKRNEEGTEIWDDEVAKLMLLEYDDIVLGANLFALIDDEQIE